MLDGNTKFDCKSYSTMKVKEATAIQNFFFNDQVPKVLPGKRNYVKRGQVKMQQRVLFDTLVKVFKDFFKLHTKFKKETEMNVS